MIVTDIASLVVQIWSALTASRSASDRNERIRHVLAALESIDFFYALLTEAKRVHDQFDQLHNISAIAFEGMRRTTDPARTREYVGNFLDNERRLVTKRATSIRIVADDPDRVPYDMHRDDVIQLPQHYNEMGKALDDYVSEVERVRALEAGIRYGDDLVYVDTARKSLALCQTLFVNALNGADQSILHIVPLVGAFHEGVKQDVQHLV